MPRLPLRAALLTAIATLALPAAAWGDGVIRLSVNGSPSQTLYAATVDNVRDVSGWITLQRGAQSGASQPVAGISVDRFVTQLAHLDPGTVKAMTIGVPGRSQDLTGDEVRGSWPASPSMDTVRTAVFGVYDHNPQFTRPVRSATDDNYDDQVLAAEMEVDVETNGGATLPAVTLTADRTASLQPGDAVAFTVSGATDVQYTFDFGDGQQVTQSGGQVSHRFQAGQWSAVVTAVRLSDGASSVSNVVPISVAADAGGTAPTPAPAGAAPAGGSGGVGSGGGAAATGGGRGGTRAPATGPKVSRGSGSVQAGAAKRQRHAPATAASRAAPLETRPAAAAAGVAVAPRHAVVRRPRPLTRRRAATETPDGPDAQDGTACVAGAPCRTAPSVPRGGPRVSGRVVDGDLRAAVTAAQALADLPEPAAPARAAAGDAWRPLGYVAGGGALIALLGLGGLRESRPRPRRRLARSGLRPVA